MRKKQKTDYHAPLEASTSFHVYNRTNNKEILFKDDGDRNTFLSKYKLYVADYVDTYSFCLLGNHFHFVLRIKPLETITNIVENIAKSERVIAQQKFLAQTDGEKTVFEVLERQFNRFFTAYAKYFNKKYQRQGNLFTRRFKRIAIKNEVYFGRLIFYVHFNPQKHQLVKDYEKYYWSSYQAYLVETPTLLSRKVILDWFGGIGAFKVFHKSSHDFDDMATLLIEDD